MRVSRELIDWLEKLTFDNQGFPRKNEDMIGMQVGTLRGLLAILNFEYKEFNRADSNSKVVHETTFIDSQG